MVPKAQQTPLETAVWRHRLLLTESEAAEAIGLTSRFLQSRRHRGDGPPFVQVSSRCVRYRPADIEAWSEARLRTSTSDPGTEPAA